MALDWRVRLLGAVLRRATGPVATMPDSKRRALRDRKAPHPISDYLNGKRATGVITTDVSEPE